MGDSSGGSFAFGLRPSDCVSDFLGRGDLSGLGSLLFFAPFAPPSSPSKPKRNGESNGGTDDFDGVNCFVGVPRLLPVKLGLAPFTDSPRGRDPGEVPRFEPLLAIALPLGRGESR